MVKRGIIFTEVHNFRVESSSINIKGIGVEINEDNKKDIFSQCGTGIDAIAYLGPKNDFKFNEKIQEVKVSNGPLIEPMAFTIILSDTALTIANSTLTSASNLSINGLHPHLEKLRNNGVDFKTDVLNFLMFSN